MKILWNLFKKLLWLIFISVSCILLFKITYPFALSLVNTLIGEHPTVVVIVQYTWLFLGAVYGIYLKKIRNDDRRRAYLIETKRMYPGFWKDCLDIIKTKDFLFFVIAFVILVVLAISALWNPSPFPSPVWAWNSGLVMIGTLLFAFGYLLIENQVHRYWIDILRVPEESEASVAWRRFNRYHMRLYIYQFIMVALFYILYLVNNYLIAIPVCFTPFLFLMYQIHGYNAIKERSDRNKPYKKYAWLQGITATLYTLTYLFGLFSPRG